MKKAILKFFVHGGQDIEIAKDIALDADLLDFIFEQFPNAKVTILSGYDEKQIFPSFDGLYNEEESKVLVKNINSIKQKYYRDISFDDGFSVNQALEASRRINNIVKEISEARLDGKPLSNYEKFLWAYQFVTDRVYVKEDQNEKPSLSRNLISIFSGDKIVCVGYASMLCTILQRLGIPCTYQTEISFDTQDGVYVNHATCAVRIDDDKYNKHGIYYSDPTADRAVVKRLFYGMTSFDCSLTPYKALSQFFEYPPIIDKSLSSLVETDDIDEVLENTIETPKILSRLFPEKTKGKSQDVLIKEQASSEIENSNIYDYINHKLDSLTMETIAEDYDKKINSILQIRLLSQTASFGNFDQFIRSNISHLATLGLTKEEVLETLKTTYSVENVEAYITSIHRKKYKINTPQTNDILKRELDKIIPKLQKLEKLVNTFNFNSVKLLDPESAIDKLAERISIDGVRHLILKERNYFSGEEIGALLKQGFTFEDIIVAIKNKVSSIDMVSLYINEHPGNLSLYVTTNENELFTTEKPTDRVYNAPYEQDFARLTNSATQFTNEEIFQAFINIYMSQGYNFSVAQEIAVLTLRRTNLPNYDMD